ncbi:hypothetical protein Tco_0690587 [Tanacetum coccineum]
MVPVNVAWWKGKKLNFPSNRHGPVFTKVYNFRNSCFPTSGKGLENGLEYKEQLHETEVATGDAYSNSDEEIALDEAASEARSSEAEEEDANLELALN